MSILKDIFDHTSKEIFFYGSHTLSTNYYNIRLIFLGPGSKSAIFNYRFSYVNIFLKYFFFYINSLFPYYKAKSVISGTVVDERIGAGFIFLETTTCQKYSTTARYVRPIRTVRISQVNISVERSGLIPIEDLVP